MTKATNNAKETKKSANVKEVNAMKKAEKAKETKTKAKGETMKELVTITINGIQITCTQEQAMEIMVACASKGVTTEPSATENKGKTSASKAKETKAKGKTSVSKGKDTNGTKANAKGKEAPTKGKETKAKGKGKGKTSDKGNDNAKAPTTRAEAIKAKYGEDNVKSFAIVASEVRTEMMAENAEMLKANNGEYPKEYYSGARWNKEFKRRMTERGFYQK